MKSIRDYFYTLKLNRSLSSKIAITLIFFERVSFLRYVILPFRVVLLNWFFNTEIPRSVVIGRGLRIPHPYNIIVHSSCIIGDKVTIYHGVTLGANDLSMNYGAPTVSDGCFLAANSMVLGRVKVGCFSIIGAGERVTDNVPDKSIYLNSELRDINGNGFSYYYKVFEN
ncbi:hypothetical protein [Shewanella algae]|uniref:hypothetical protein n=1 Tax=Shewanella algae TaxID=38313 RepID=UPI0030067FDD